MRVRDNRVVEPVPLHLDDPEKGDAGVRIELQNVWFKYPTRDVPVLQGLSLAVSFPSLRY